MMSLLSFNVVLFVVAQAAREVRWSGLMMCVWRCGREERLEKLGLKVDNGLRVSFLGE
jgi:hypothetical protein